jgi:hypothetical protein
MLGSLRHLGWETAKPIAPTSPKTVPWAKELNLKDSFLTIALISFALFIDIIFLAFVTEAPFVC